MFELPRRETELAVEVEKGAVTLYVAPLTDTEYFRATETTSVETEGDGEEVQTRLVFHASRMPGLFEAKLRRIEGVGPIDGKPFDASDPAHLARVPQTWKGAAVMRLIRYAMGMDAEMGNGSKPRDGSSPAAETPSED